MMTPLPVWISKHPMYGCKALPHMVVEKTFSLRAECVCCRQKSIPFQTSHQFATSMKVRLLKVGHSLRRSLSISHDLRFRENGSWVSVQFGLMKCASPHDVLPCCLFLVCAPPGLSSPSGMWGGRSLQWSPSPLGRRTQCYGPQGSGRSAGGSAGSRRWMGRWGRWREWRTQGRRDTLTSCMDMRCAHKTDLSHAMRCATHVCWRKQNQTEQTKGTKHMLMSSVEFHVLCVEVGLDLGCHVVIGVVLVFFTTQTQYQVQNTFPSEFCSPIVHV